MKSLYVTSVERFSGKTATCLALALNFKASGHRVGYLKPLSLQPWRGAEKVIDEDAAFVNKILGLVADPADLSPVVITPGFLQTILRGDLSHKASGLMEQVKTAYDRASKDVDILLLEGGASLREGYTVGLPTPAVAEAFASKVLVIVKFQDEIRLLDDILASQKRLGATLAGVLINRLPEEANSFINELAKPYLEAHGIPVFGIFPEVRGLAALTVSEVIEALGAEVLTKKTNTMALVENLTIGAMSAEAALSRFRKQINKAVITGGDRTDIQLAALETSTACLILTGNLRPSPLVVKQAEEFGVTTMLVRTNTMETIEKIDDIYGKTRLGQEAKLKQFEKLVAEHFDFLRLHQVLEF